MHARRIGPRHQHQGVGRAEGRRRDLRRGDVQDQDAVARLRRGVGQVGQPRRPALRLVGAERDRVAEADQDVQPGLAVHLDRGRAGRPRWAPRARSGCWAPAGCLPGSGASCPARPARPAGSAGAAPWPPAPTPGRAWTCPPRPAATRPRWRASRSWSHWRCGRPGNRPAPSAQRGRRATTAAWISPARTAKFGSPSTSVCTLRTPRTASASAWLQARGHERKARAAVGRKDVGELGRAVEDDDLGDDRLGVQGQLGLGVRGGGGHGLDGVARVGHEGGVERLGAARLGDDQQADGRDRRGLDGGLAARAARLSWRIPAAGGHRRGSCWVSSARRSASDRPAVT